jgi:hypothetical protein
MIATVSTTVAFLLWLTFIDLPRTVAPFKDAADGMREELEVASAVERFVCSSDKVVSSQGNVKERFRRAVVLHSCCLMARQARLWGALEWHEDLSLERNVERSLPLLVKMLTPGLGGSLPKVDGFVFELRGPSICSNVSEFASSVRRLLATVSKNNPDGRDCLKRFGGRLSQTTWSFEFNRQTLFVTTFAPFYDSLSHSRACRSAPDTCYVLLQPDDSFARHNLTPDTPLTNWESPQTMRDHIRKRHRSQGQPYTIPKSASYPAADHIVKAEDNDSPVIQWWDEGENTDKQHTVT